MIVSRSHCPPWCVTHWFICHLTGIWHLADINFWTVVTGKSKSSRVFLDKHPPLVEKKPKKKNAFAFAWFEKYEFLKDNFSKMNAGKLNLIVKAKAGGTKRASLLLKKGSHVWKGFSGEVLWAGRRWRGWRRWGIEEGISVCFWRWSRWISVIWALFLFLQVEWVEDFKDWRSDRQRFRSGEGSLRVKSGQDQNHNRRRKRRGKKRES